MITKEQPKNHKSKESGVMMNLRRRASPIDRNQQRKRRDPTNNRGINAWGRSTRANRLVIEAVNQDYFATLKHIFLRILFLPSRRANCCPLSSPACAPDPTKIAMRTCGASISLLLRFSLVVAIARESLQQAVPVDAKRRTRHLQTAGSETSDANILCDFYNTMPATGKAKLTNWCGAKTTTGSYVNGPCTGTAGAWLGVSCSVVGGVSRVTSINLCTWTAAANACTLGATALGGSLPASIGGLDALTKMDVGGAGILGSIPSALGALTGLTWLGLCMNSLSGSIPSSLAALSRLTYLGFAYNSLSGNIPSSLGALTGLNTLYFHSNALTGPVPVSFCNLRPLTDLEVLGNPGLTCYPSCLSTYSTFMAYKGSLSAVCTAESYDANILCDFYNTMPATGKAKLTNWCGAKTTTGSYVNGPCTGTAGAWLGVTCAVVGGVSRVTKLDTYNAGAMTLGGNLPPSIGGLNALTNLRLSDSDISGSIPLSLGTLTSLTYLALDCNLLSGSIPSTLGGLTALTLLAIEKNSFSGIIPSSMGALIALTYIALDSNAFTGPIANSFCSLKPSISLAVSSNPGLTCYPSCLSIFTGVTKDASLPSCDQKILCDFYNTVPAANRAKLTNWCGAGDASSVCGAAGTSSWKAVTCAVVGGVSRVTILNTYNAGVRALGGSLPISIGGLDALSVLQLAEAGLSGSIPFSVGSLTGLIHLGVWGNSLSSSIPSSVGALTKLTLLSLGGNPFIGTIPTSLGDLTGLTDLGLNVNSLSGTIPSFIGTFTSLSILYLNQAALVGPIPSSFCSLKPTIDLRVQTNPGLTCYPSCLSTYSTFMAYKGSLSAVCTAESYDANILCDFYNTMPATAKAKLTNWCGAKTTAGSYVNGPCTGTAGAWLGVRCAVVGGMSRIRSIETCQWTGSACAGLSSSGGSLPLSIGGLDALIYLDLGIAGLTGSIPVSIGALTGLTYLGLAVNSFSNNVPSSLGALTKLTSMHLDRNALTGPVPTTFCSLKPTIGLRIQSNPGLTCYPSCLSIFTAVTKDASLPSCDQKILCDFYNTVPAANRAKLTNWCGAGDASSVCGAAGTSNWLGVTCAVVGGVSRVTILNTYNAGLRALGGSLPTSIGGLDALTVLQLAHFLLSGSIPSSIGGLTGLSYLSLDQNSLVGTIPFSLGTLTGLTHLALNTNSLSGNVPASLGGLSGLTSLSLNLNSLSGSIPTSLGLLTMLAGINFDTNSLTGPVPASFCSLKPTIILYVQTNPGLTCYPPCLAADPNFQKDASLRGCGDEQVLCDFYNTVPAANRPKLINWCGTGDASSVCGAAGTSSWLGVTCAVVGGVSRVTSFNTFNAGVRAIGGSLPTSIGGLDALTNLGLGFASISGSIPSSVGGLTGLTYLALDYGPLAGNIPSSLGALIRLTTLALGSNALIGTIPFSLGGLTSLTLLFLGTNALTGPVPASFCNLKSTIDLRVGTNPGLTCYPSCLSTNTNFMSTGKGTTWQCTAAPTARPTNPTAIPTPAPSVNPTPQPTTTPTAKPTVIPTASPTPIPSSVPTPQPSSNPTPQPSAVPTYPRLQTFSKTVESTTISAATLSQPASYAVPDAAFDNLDDGTGLQWYLTIEAFGTGWGSSDPYVNFNLLGARGATTPLAEYCNPGNSCGGNRVYPAGAGPARCVMNFPITTTNMNADNGGSIVIQATTNFASTYCTYQNSKVVFTYTLTATNPQPSYAPSLSPTSAPFAGGVPPPTQPPSLRPTSPSPAPSALPTLAPTNNPSPMPSYAQATVIQRTAFAASLPYDIASVTVTNMNAGQGMNWFVKVEVFATGYQGSNPFVLVSFTGASPLGSVRCSPFHSACGSDGLYPLTGAMPFLCATNFLVQPSDLDPARGGSLTISATPYGVIGAACPYKGNDIYLSYTLSAAVAMPTLLPTAMPSPVPTSAAPSTLPTAPSAKPSPEPTTVPSALPSAPPSAEPTAALTHRPTSVPTALPTFRPTALPSPEPTDLPTVLPSPLPTLFPTYNKAGGLAIPAVFLGADASSSSGVFETPPFAFTNLDTKGDISEWFLNVDVYATGLGPNTIVSVTLQGLTGAVSGPEADRDGRELGQDDAVSANTFVCTPPADAPCPADRVPVAFRCPAIFNLPIPAALLAAAKGGTFSVATSTQLALNKASCPFRDQGRRFDLYVRYSLSAGSSPTPEPSAQPTQQPTTAAPNLALLIANQQQAQGLNDVVMSKGAPMYAVGGGAALFALVAMLLFQVRDQVAVDASAGRRGSRASIDATKMGKHASVAVVKLNLVATIVGSALTGAAFVSECFLIQLLFADQDTASLGYVAFLGRFVHVAAAMLIFYLISKSKTRRVLASVRPLKPLYSTAIYKANLKLYGVLFLLAMCDVTLLRFLPWRDSQFAKETSGYPSPFVFLSLVYTKLLQSALTVSCQAMLLMQLLKSFSGGAFPPSLAFLVLNMAVTVAMLLVNLLEAGLRTGLLGGWTAADDEDRAASTSLTSLAQHASHAHSHASHASQGAVEMAPIGGTNPMHGQDQHLRHSLSAEHRIDAYEGYTGYSPDVAAWDRRSLSQSEHEGQGQGQGHGRTSMGRLSGSAPSAIFDHTVAHMHHGGDVGARPGRLSHGPASSPALARLPPPGAFSPSAPHHHAAPMHHVAPGRIDVSNRASLAAAPLPPMLHLQQPHQQQPRLGPSHAGPPVAPVNLARPSFSRPQSHRSLGQYDSE